MSRPPGTVITVMVDGRHRRLLTLRDRPATGDVTVILSPAETYTDPPHAGTAIRSQKYSIHPSPASPNNTIKHTIELEGDVALTSVLTTAGLKTGGVTPLFFKAVPQLDAERHDVEVRAKDTRIALAPMDSRKATLIYGLLVAPKAGPRFLPARRNIRYRIVEVGQYRFFIAYSLVPIFTHHLGELVHNVSAPPRSSKAPPRTEPGRIYEGVSVVEAARGLKAHFDHLHGRVLAFHAGSGFPPQHLQRIAAQGYCFLTDAKFKRLWHPILCDPAVDEWLARNGGSGQSGPDASDGTS